MAIVTLLELVHPTVLTLLQPTSPRGKGLGTKTHTRVPHVRVDMFAQKPEFVYPGLEEHLHAVSSTAAGTTLRQGVA